MLTETHHGEVSHCLSSADVSLAVTARAGHLAPVTFHLPNGPARPYALAPWLPDECPEPALLAVLRGDFFCLPFGPQADGPPHGAPANDPWELVLESASQLHLRQNAADSGAVIEKILSLRPGHYAIYAEHRISELSGNFSYGTHPILDLSQLKNGPARVSTSAFHWASVNPSLFSDPADGASQCLLPGGCFSDLANVPLRDGGTLDLSHYPHAQPGNDDLVLMANVPATPEQPFAWSAVVFDSFVWFALKNPRDFPATMLWLSHGGRSAAPWNSRHTYRLGVEDVCSHFADSVDVSRSHPLAALGIPTTRAFSAESPTALRHIQGCAAIPNGYSRVTEIRPAGDSAILLTDENGLTVSTALDWSFVTA